MFLMFLNAKEGLEFSSNLFFLGGGGQKDYIFCAMDVLRALQILTD